jgi:soluble lytic murein transglycosylase-like protein
MLQKALGTLSNSRASGKRPIPKLQDLLHSLLLPQGAYPYPEISQPRLFAHNPPREQTDSDSASRRGCNNFRTFIEEASRSFGVEKSLIRAVIKAESNFNPRATSPAGAVGLMQLLPSTAEEMGVRDLFDPRDNIHGGTRYLAALLDRYDGNLTLALAAYNWGPGNLEKAPERLPHETQTYIERVLRYLDTLTV